MKLHYYPETDSLYIDLSMGVSNESKEISKGVVVDYDEEGNIIGLDIDHASKVANLQQLTVAGFAPAIHPDPGS